MPWGLPCGSAGKESACNDGDLGSIPGLGRCPGEGKGYPFQYSGLENSMACIVHGVTKSWTRLSNFHVHFHNIWDHLCKRVKNAFLGQISYQEHRTLGYSGNISFYYIFKKTISFHAHNVRQNNCKNIHRT